MLPFLLKIIQIGGQLLFKSMIVTSHEAFSCTQIDISNGNTVGDNFIVKPHISFEILDIKKIQKPKKELKHQIK